MSDTENLGHAGRPWKVEGTFKDYEPAKSLSERLATAGIESKVKRTAAGFTVRTRTAPDAPPAETKTKRKGK